MTGRGALAALVLGLAFSAGAVSPAAAQAPSAAAPAVSGTRPPAPTGPPVAPFMNRPCATDSRVVATAIVPPAPFKARVISVRQMSLPQTSSVRASFHHPLRLYRVTFRALRGNAVLPSGHTYAQFAYVGQPVPPAGRWCFLSGGSGP
jgi:hypothetical protein